MDRIKQLEIKKLLKELEFIESDYEYKSEIISDADSEFVRGIGDFLSKHPDLKEIFDRDISSKIDESIKKSQESIEEKKELDVVGDNIQSEASDDECVDDIKIRRIYREIVKLTHPDKSKDKKLEIIYIKATDMYNIGDIAGLYSICDNLGIQYDVNEEDIEIISSKIKHMKDRISFIESTFTWMWFYSKDEKERDHIIFTYIKNRLQKK